MAAAAGVDMTGITSAAVDAAMSKESRLRMNTPVGLFVDVAMLAKRTSPVACVLPRVASVRP
ncbi:hypothetical protein Saso_25870 [Streptomyces asoensis]|uniref:Uncharacterized protein n=1 Tax=Streptomyces asoensis TaxID=249586 RepID=A0ABQ3RYQ4_9ACTN|nr:hypothetical protein GCM10010496_07450 [Streptomyces asoensis]GHI60937.1 hypothetical protein Saso_25870 [Streptomyces asoensis]